MLSAVSTMLTSRPLATAQIATTSAEVILPGQVLTVPREATG